MSQTEFEGRLIGPQILAENIQVAGAQGTRGYIVELRLPVDSAEYLRLYQEAFRIGNALENLKFTDILRPGYVDGIIPKVTQFTVHPKRGMLVIDAQLGGRH